MCGIAGVLANGLPIEVATRRVGAMVDAMRHRGPDDEGIDVIAKPASGSEGRILILGHRRLSIIDLSAAGHQPMRDPETGNWLTYNGEIYNFVELRAELNRCGHVFHSRCDTEVILKAYAEWGVGTWRRLRGIFAFGLWDQQAQELYLVRDHLGVKPLYYAHTDAGLAFASEVRALLASEWVVRRIDQSALQSYLKYGSVQEPCTLVAGIASLPPGHYLTCGQKGVIARHYWKMTESLARHWIKAPQPEEVRGHLEDTVGRQLVADVPVGVFLSGGLDSAAIAALAARNQPGNVRTFCIGSDSQRDDESGDAAETAAFLGCRHTTLVLEGRLVHERLAHALRSYDQPSVDGINTYFISLLVRDAGIKVALSGLGGDELFVGYNGFQKARQMEKLGRVFRQCPMAARKYLSRLIGRIGGPGAALTATLSEAFETDLACPYFAGRTLFSRQHINRLFSDGKSTDGALVSWRAREQQLAKESEVVGEINRLSFLEMQTYMLSTLLRDSDQMSMAHGLELRVPFIDPWLIEHVLPISAEAKLAGTTHKGLLHDSVRDLVPPQLARRSKRGFNLPFQQWLHSDLEPALDACFNSSHLNGPWERRAFSRVWADFRAGRVTWSRILALFVLENWLQDNKVVI